MSLDFIRCFFSTFVNVQVRGSCLQPLLFFCPTRDDLKRFGMDRARQGGGIAWRYCLARTVSLTCISLECSQAVQEESDCQFCSAYTCQWPEAGYRCPSRVESGTACCRNHNCYIQSSIEARLQEGRYCDGHTCSSQDWYNSAESGMVPLVECTRPRHWSRWSPTNPLVK